jgi:hypothetical protein
MLFKLTIVKFHSKMQILLYLRINLFDKAYLFIQNITHKKNLLLLHFPFYQKKKEYKQMIVSNRISIFFNVIFY